MNDASDQTTGEASVANGQHSGPEYLVDSTGNRIAVDLSIAACGQLIERFEDYEDTIWSHDYEACKVAGPLTLDELETIPLERVLAEFEDKLTPAEQRAE